MTDFHPYRPRNPSPWPRRLALAVLITAVALALYVFSAHAAGPKPPLDTSPRWGAEYYCNQADPRPPATCIAGWSRSRRPVMRHR